MDNNDENSSFINNRDANGIFKENNGILRKCNNKSNYVKNKQNKASPDITKLKKKPGIIDLFRYSNCFDKFLIISGIIISCISGAIFPTLFAIYGNVAQVLIDYDKSRTLLLNATLNSSNQCLTNLNDTNVDYGAKIDSSIALFVIFGFLSLFFNFFGSFIWSIYGERQTNRIRKMLFESLLKKQIEFYDNFSPGQLNAKINNNIKSYSNGICDKFGDAISMSIRFIVFIIIGFYYSAYFTLVFLPIIAIISLSAATMFIFSKKYTLKETKIYENAGKIAQQAINAIRTVNAFNLHKKLIDSYDKNLNDIESIVIKRSIFTTFFIGLSEFFLYFGFGVTFLFGIFLLQLYCGQKIFGNITATSFCMWNCTFALGQALIFLNDLSQAIAAAHSIFEIFDYESVIDSSKNTGLKLDGIKGDIELNQVTFSYPRRPDALILNNLSLKIEAGKTIAICGGSGGGKSTIIQLIQRFYDPNDGQVMLDGHDIKDLNINWLRSQMALVSQEPVLFATTIRENIRMGRLDATDEECEEAAKQANIHSFIVSNLKDGYDTYVGERGSQLSGGQKQRISIARALIRNPKILLLDEATSALDFESEKQVQQALNMAKIGRTTIIVAHRLSTIRSADLIIALKDGQVHEMGTHDELIVQKGVYYQLNADGFKGNFNTIQSINWDLDNDYEDMNEIDDFIENEESQKLRSTMVRKQKLNDFFNVQKFLWSYHRPDVVFILVGVIGQCLKSGTIVAIVVLTAQIFRVASIIDLVEQRNQSYLYSGIIFGLALMNLLCNVISSIAFNLSGARLTKCVRVNMFESILRQEVGWHDLTTNQSSILCMRLENNASLCKGVSTDLLCLLTRSLSGVGIALIVSFLISWKLTLVLSVFVPVIFFSGIFRGQMMVNKSNSGKCDIKLGKLLIECVDNIRTVASIGLESHFINTFDEIIQSKNPFKSKDAYKRAIYYALCNSTFCFCLAANFKLGFILIGNNELKPVNLYQVYEVIMVLTVFLGREASALINTKKAFIAAKNSYKIIKRKSLIDSLNTSGRQINNIKGSIEFHDVHFHYPTREIKVLNGLNLKINENEMTGIVGKSGCGKSTIIQLLLRFYDVDEGKITLDGVDIRELNIKWLRSQFGLVSQEPVLFDTTIMENIDIEGTGTQNKELIVDVAKRANIHDRIQNFPKKYETNVGHKGLQISVGEKQRIAIARALIREPRILLLDEATSALDNESEKLVQIGLDNARMNRTCICIAHRLSTIEASDKISVLENGRVLEEGTHDELMKNRKLYLKFQRTQSLF